MKSSIGFIPGKLRLGRWAMMVLFNFYTIMKIIYRLCLKILFRFKRNIASFLRIICFLSSRNLIRLQSILLFIKI